MKYLDQFPDERLFICLQKFDCLLFVETVLEIFRKLHYKITITITLFTVWNNTVIAMVKMNGYCSLFHYFSDWIRDNQARVNVEDITNNLGVITQ